MGSATDPIYVLVSSHTQSPDGSTRNDTFYMTATLNNYAAQLANNIATPVWNMVSNEAAYMGGTGPIWPQYSTPLNTGTNALYDPAWMFVAAGGPVSLRAEVGVGVEPLATPLRYHLTKWDELSTPISPNLGVGGQMIYNWINNILLKMTTQNLYTGMPYTNG